MQQEGYSQFAQTIIGIINNKGSKHNSLKKASNLAAILHVCSNCNVAVFNKNFEEEKKEDMDMINSGKNVFRPPYVEQP